MSHIFSGIWDRLLWLLSQGNFGGSEMFHSRSGVLWGLNGSACEA